VTWVLDPNSGLYYDDEADINQDSSWRDAMPEPTQPEPAGMPWTLDPAGSGRSYRGDAALPENWDDFGWSDERRYTDLLSRMGSAQADDRLQSRNFQKQQHQDQMAYYQRQLDQSLLLAREAAAAHREEWKAVMEERAEAARRELERLKRLDYANTTGMTYALPGEPALPTVTYNANYRPAAPLPPSRFAAAPAAAPAGIMGNLAGGGQ
jgi:hypothetical protein